MAHLHSILPTALRTAWKIDENGLVMTARRYLIIYLSAILVLGIGVSTLSGWGSDPYNPRTAFRDVKPGQILIDNGIKEWDRIEIRIDKTLDEGPPRIGLFGSHVTQYLSAEEIGYSDNDVMNYFVMHIGLPEIAIVLRHLEANNALPKETILVHLHHPHSPNWEHIIYGIWELPIFYYVKYSRRRISHTIRDVVRMAGARMRDRLGLENTLFNIIDGPVLGCDAQHGIMAVDETSDVEPKPPAVKQNGTIRKTLIAMGLMKAPRRVFNPACGPTTGLRRDGSSGFQRSSFKADIVPDGEALKPNPLAAGSAAEIVRQMQGIAETGRRNGRRVVFFVPPIYEKPRESDRSNMLDMAVSKARGEGMQVIDHRLLRHERELFFSQIYTSPRYLRRLLTELNR